LVVVVLVHLLDCDPAENMEWDRKPTQQAHGAKPGTRGERDLASPNAVGKRQKSGLARTLALP
jgi:hypothetical protein